MDKRLSGGVYSALLTPTDAGGGVAHDALRRLVDWNLEHGVEGMYVCGSTGEAFMLSGAERRAVLETVVEQVAGRCPVVAQIGTIDLARSLDLARHADALGVAAISAVLPFYYGFRAEEILGYYRAIADTIETPLLLYYYPQVAGGRVGLPELLSLLEHPNVIGLKYKATDFFVMERIRAAAPGALIFNGFDEMCTAGLATGADGMIGSTVNVMAPLYVALRDAVAAGELAEARALQARINRLIAALIEAGVIAGLKALLNDTGLGLGDARAPFAMPDEATLAGLRETWREVMAQP